MPLKVIENDTTRKLGYGFLFPFHNNYGPICIVSEMNQDIGRKSPLFTPAFDTPVGGGSPLEYCHNVWCGENLK